MLPSSDKRSSSVAIVRASERAWHFFLGSLNSGYMYYGTAVDMEVKPTIACNEAIAEANNTRFGLTASLIGGSYFIWRLRRL